ncbi:unnamed protein product [Phaeothamnion confervicola]
MRWALCTDDIYYASSLLTPMLALGRTLPVKRHLGVDQPLLGKFADKLRQGEWCHIFAEGRIRQPWRFARGEPVLGGFKPGVSRILFRCKEPPLVIPMYHIGMHGVCPEEPCPAYLPAKLQTAYPAGGNRVRVYVGEPVDVWPIVLRWREGFPGQPGLGDMSGEPWGRCCAAGFDVERRCYAEIADALREAVLKLEAKARRDYFRDKGGVAHVEEAAEAAEVVAALELDAASTTV